jgi:CRISPR-associated endonuclease Csn1
VDAVVVALCNQGWIQRLSEANRGALAARRRLFAPVEPPWVGFKEQLKDILKSMNISFRPDHRVTGALHKESHYGYSKVSESDNPVFKIRKPVYKLTKSMVQEIVDQAVRSAVQEKLAAVGGKVEALKGNWPVLQSKNGQSRPIKKVRIQVALSPIEVGKNHRKRFVEVEDTHHMEVFEVPGRLSKWKARVVKMHEAAARLVCGANIFDRHLDSKSRYLFSLMKGDCLQMHGEMSGIWIIKTIRANTQIELVSQYDARPVGSSKGGARVTRKCISEFQKFSPRKVVVLPIGDVVRCNE